MVGKSSGDLARLRSSQALGEKPHPFQTKRVRHPTAGALLDFGDLHGLVDGEGGVADGGVGRGGGVASDSFEVAGGAALERVGVAVAFGPGHVDGVGGDEFVEIGTMIVECEEAAFGLRDLQEVAADAGEADGLRWGGASIGGWHFLERVFVDDEGYACKDEEGG